MMNKKISELDEVAEPLGGDVLPIVSGNATKKITIASLLALILADSHLTGTPTAPTADAATNSDQLATTAFVHALFTALIGTAPINLDTLQEIASQLAADESAVAAIVTTLAGKANTVHTHLLAQITDVTATPAELNALHLAAPMNVFGGNSFPLNGRHVSPFAHVTVAGITDLYTCPVGKRAFVHSCWALNQHASITLNAVWRTKVGATYYRLSPVIVSPAGIGTSAGTVNSGDGRVLEAGETLSYDAAVNQTALIAARIYEYDAAYPLYSARNVNIIAGSNLIVDAGAKRLLLTPGLWTSSAAQVRVSNESGATRQVSAHIIDNVGDALDVTNQVTNQFNVTNNNIAGTNLYMPTVLETGKKLALKSDGAGNQHAWVTALEM
jgi:hypothetical protein